MESTNDEFDAIAWLKGYFNQPGLQINNESIKQVLHFALLWNMFESLACKRSANVQTITTFVTELYEKNLIQEDVFSPYLKYFRERYVENGATNDNFEWLKFRRNDPKEMVASVLLNNLSDINNQVIALLCIILRLRNNLFHGEKNVATLNYQNDTFNVANQLLASVLNIAR